MDKKAIIADLTADRDRIIDKLMEINNAIAAVEAVGAPPKPKKVRRPRKPKVVTVTAAKQKPIKVTIDKPKRHRRTKKEMQALKAADKAMADIADTTPEHTGGNTK